MGKKATQRQQKKKRKFTNHSLASMVTSSDKHILMCKPLDNLVDSGRRLITHLVNAMS